MPIPSKADFQRATNLKVAITDKRTTDTILNRIDALIDAFHAERAEPAQAILLAKLYYATDAWLKKADRGESGVNARRKPAVYELFVQAVQELSRVTGVPVNLLPNWLAETFGKSMVEHGAELDIRDNLADYLSEMDVRKFRISFRGGLAYQQRWWTNRTDWVLASSANVATGTAPLAAAQGNPDANVITAGFSGYVMSQGGDLYTGPHFAPAVAKDRKQNSGRYHSSYFGGEAVLSAGEIKIERGRIVEINTSSGHYQPTAAHMRTAIETLAMHGVALDTLWVAAFGRPRMLGSAFVALEGLEATPVDRGLFLPRPGWAASGHGDMPASRARVTATLSAHKTVQDRQAAFALFRLHCAPKSNGGTHGPAGRLKCPQCKEVEKFWGDYVAHVGKGA